MAREELARGAGVALFAAATVTKAWEPLSVAYAEDAGRHRFLFAAALVLCECAKLIATATPLLARRLRGDPTESAAWLVSARSARAFGPPALMLAFTNHLLGVGVVLLDPLVYQVLFRVISVVFTAALSSLVLRRELRGAQKLALLLLLLGFYLALPGSGEPRHGPKLGGASAIGLMATACGAASFSLQAVWFEAATVAPGARQSTLTQTAALALWGVVANGLLLVALHGPALLAARRSPLVGFTERAWLVVASIAASDLAMAVFCKYHGANTCSFSGVLAMLVSALVGWAVLRLHLTQRFVLGGALVALSGWLYQHNGRDEIREWLRADESAKMWKIWSTRGAGHAPRACHAEQTERRHSLEPLLGR